MLDSSFHLLIIRIFISCGGLLGNAFLIFSIIQSQTRLSKVKSFEFFLLGLAMSNLEEILIVDIYEIVILQSSSGVTNTWACRLLKFLTMFGEISSILFTVLISVYRYQKMRDSGTRGNMQIYLDSIRSARMMSGLCVTLSVLLSLPIFVLDLEVPDKNVTIENVGCPPDFFHCNAEECHLVNGIYKYLFLVLCDLVPLLIITVTSVLIISVLLSQRKRVVPTSQLQKKKKGPRVQRSTLAVLAAMGLFQVDWTLYLIFQLMVSPDESPFWAEMEFFISTSYTSISPYVFGIGNNLFSLKNIMKK